MIGLYVDFIISSFIFREMNVRQETLLKTK